MERVGRDDNFFDLGGHSLLTIRVHTLPGRKVQRALSITDLFRFPTTAHWPNSFGRGGRWRGRVRGHVGGPVVDRRHCAAKPLQRRLQRSDRVPEGGRGESSPEPSRVVMRPRGGEAKRAPSPPGGDATGEGARRSEAPSPPGWVETKKPECPSEEGEAPLQQGAPTSRSSATARRRNRSPGADASPSERHESMNGCNEAQK